MIIILIFWSDYVLASHFISILNSDLIRRGGNSGQNSWPAACHIILFGSQQQIKCVSFHESYQTLYENFKLLHLMNNKVEVLQGFSFYQASFYSNLNKL